MTERRSSAKQSRTAKDAAEQPRKHKAAEHPREDETAARGDESTTRGDVGGADEDVPTPGRVLVAFEKLFGGGRGVKRFARSGLRYVDLGGGAVLVEQNPKKTTEWAELARRGRRVAWLLRDGEYLARVVDGEVVMLD
ncbi:MAG TPA: hypothetical protein VGV38_05825 [Pyrinomonadaceae bacterium]|nr:hypothetical protein [Pyrinomonadaceae bacterium]